MIIKFALLNSFFSWARVAGRTLQRVVALTLVLPVRFCGLPVHEYSCLIQTNCWKLLVTGRNEVVAKVIFLHLSVILFTGGGACLRQPPREQTPLGADPPRADPLGADTPPRSRHPPRADTPPGSRPPGSRHPSPRSATPSQTLHCPGTKYTPMGLSTPPGTKYTPQD